MFGYALDSEVELRRARRSPGDRGVLRIRRHDGDVLALRGELASWSDEGGAESALALTAGGVVAWCGLTGGYLLDPGAGEIRLQTAGGQDDWEHRLGSLVVPLLMAERGDLALHAATVSDGERSVVICGGSGRGKSTLAAALDGLGHAVLAEDGSVLTVDGSALLAWPGLAGARLSDASARALGRPLPPVRPQEDPSTRRPVHLDVGPESAAPAPVAAIVVLGERGGEEVEHERLDPAHALAVLMHCAIYAGPSRTAGVLRAVTAAVERVPVHWARLPDDLSSVSAHAAGLFAAVRGEGDRA